MLLLRRQKLASRSGNLYVACQRKTCLPRHAAELMIRASIANAELHLQVDHDERTWRFLETSLQYGDGLEWKKSSPLDVRILAIDPLRLLKAPHNVMDHHHSPKP